MCYYLEIVKNGQRIPVGPRLGYLTIDEAKEGAKKYVDDALPYNEVRIMHHVGTARLAGDGGTNYTGL